MDILEKNSFLNDKIMNIIFKIKESLQPILPPPPSCVKRGATERQPSEQMSSLTTSSPATVLPNTITQPSGAWSEKDVDKQFNDFEITKITASSSANDEERENEVSQLFFNQFSYIHKNYFNLIILLEYDQL